jgi:hypothetical protein
MKLNFPAPSGPRLGGVHSDEAEFSSTQWSKVGGKSKSPKDSGSPWMKVGVHINRRFTVPSSQGERGH